LIFDDTLVINSNMLNRTWLNFSPSILRGQFATGVNLPLNYLKWRILAGRDFDGSTNRPKLDVILRNLFWRKAK